MILKDRGYGRDSVRKVLKKKTEESQLEYKVDRVRCLIQEHQKSVSVRKPFGVLKDLDLRAEEV